MNTNEKAQALIISNNAYSHSMYVAGIAGYGYDVHDTHTFETASILLRTGYQPTLIIIDMKMCGQRCNDFIQSAQAMLSPDCRIIVIGKDSDVHVPYGVHHYLPRPAQLEQLIACI
jgi:ActR/RegA family two-component response regulator